VSPLFVRVISNRGLTPPARPGVGVARLARHLRPAGRVVRIAPIRPRRVAVAEVLFEFLVGLVGQEIDHRHDLSAVGLGRPVRSTRGGGLRRGAVADVRHPQPEQQRRRLAPALLVLRPQLAAEREHGLGERLVGDLAAGGGEQPAVPGPGVAGELLEGVLVGVERGGGGLPRQAPGAQDRGADEERIGGGGVGCHGGNRVGRAGGRQRCRRPICLPVQYARNGGSQM
jgi:hypothetical protein